jgi:preprotein translocase subunit Sss1
LSGAVALGGVGFIVWLATSLLTPSTITLPQVRTQPEFKELRKLVAADPTAYLGLWGNDVESFMENRSTEFAALGNVDRQIASLPSGDPRLSGLNEARPLLLKSVEACGKVSARLLAVAGFHDLSRRFSRAKSWMFGAAVIVVVGVVGFTATTPGGGGDAGKEMAVPALVSLTSQGAAEVGPVLGSYCPQPFKGVLLSGGAGGPWQLMVTDPKCRNGTLTLSKEQAAVMSVFPSP